MKDIVIKLRQSAVDRAEDLRVAAFGPGGGDPGVMPGDMLSWKAADRIEELEHFLDRLGWNADFTPHKAVDDDHIVFVARFVDEED